MKTKESQIKEGLTSLIKQYESELTFLHSRDMDTFRVDSLPQIIQDMIKLAVSKSPSFSNISALAIANFVLSSTFGGLRPVINDPVYSDDSLGVNSYSILLAPSG